MFGFLLTLMILDGFLLIVVVLLQSGKGGGLAAMGGGVGMGTDSLIGGRQAATLLTRLSWITGGIFLALALVLSIMSTRAQRPSSVLQGEFQQETPAQPQPVLPGATPQGDAGATPQIPGAQPTTPQNPGTQPQGGAQPNPGTQPNGGGPGGADR